MIFLVHLTLLEAILFYGGLFVAAVLMYLLAVRTRKTHTCKHCGETVTIQQMNAKNCNSCGRAFDQMEGVS